MTEACPTTSPATAFRSEIQTEGSFSHTFDDTGDYPYVCTLHSGMRGTVTVVDA